MTKKLFLLYRLYKGGPMELIDKLLIWFDDLKTQKLSIISQLAELLQKLDVVGRGKCTDQSLAQPLGQSALRERRVSVKPVSMSK